jgi:hypothetical protein
MSQFIEIAKVVSLSSLALTCGWLLVRARGSSRRAANRKQQGRADQERLEIALRLAAKLEERIDALDQLVRDVDQRIARLEALNPVATRHSDAETPSKLAASPEVDGMLRVDIPDDRLGATAMRRHEEIYTLADSGWTSAAIAGHVGSPVGEIELILGLRASCA